MSFIYRIVYFFLYLFYTHESIDIEIDKKIKYHFWTIKSEYIFGSIIVWLKEDYLGVVFLVSWILCRKSLKNNTNPIQRNPFRNSNIKIKTDNSKWQSSMIWPIFLHMQHHFCIPKKLVFPNIARSIYIFKLIQGVP